MKKTDIKEMWNRAADSWIDFVREGKDFVRAEMSNPSMFELLGDIQGKVILDLGCGEGYNSRILAEMEAQVIGIDISDILIEKAIEWEENNEAGITYHTMDASDLHGFKDESFDIVTCFMALMDMRDYENVIAEVSRVLKIHGRFLFNIPHPCFEIRFQDGDFEGGWEYQISGKDESSKIALYYKVDRYFDSQEEELIPWEMERLQHPFHTIAFHRTLTEYSHALYETGFRISRMIEPKPTKKALEDYPILRGFDRVPHSIAIEAIKQ